MAQNVIINGEVYNDVPAIQIPKSTSGTANFVDTSDATASAAAILSGQTAYINGSKITGTIASKTAATITPGISDVTIASGQYLSGAQVIKGDPNLVAANIAAGVSIFGITGTHSSGSSVTITDEPDSHGGTIRHIVIDGEGGGGGSTDPYPWWGPSSTLYSSYNFSVNLSDTSWSDWTATTTATSILTAPASADFSFTFDREDEVAMVVTQAETEYHFASGATLKSIPTQFVRMDISCVYGYPSTIDGLSTNTVTSQTSVSAGSLTRGYYNNSSGKKTVLTGSYGVYHYGAPSYTYSASESTVTVEYKRNAIYARCNSTYFATSRKSAIDVDTTKINFHVRVYKVPRASSFWVTEFTNVVNLINS